MKKTIDKYDFRREFEEFRRKENFSYAGLDTLFAYLEEVEQDCGKEFELDVIAICCEYTEYDEEELISQYGHKLDREEDQDDDEYLEALLDELEQWTTVLKVEDSHKSVSYILQAF